MDPRSNLKKDMSGQPGFTLLEILLVIALIAVMYSAGAPLLSNLTAEIETRLGTLSSDIRSAYDLSVLSGKPYRMVFDFDKGEYWLEETDQRNFFLGDRKLDRDLTEREERDLQTKFEDEFEEYVELAGQEIEIPDSDEVVKPESPVIKAKALLRPAKWYKVTNQEWKVRSLGTEIGFLDIQTEHHEFLQKWEDMEEGDRVLLHFFPKGYVEKAVIHIGRKEDEITFYPPDDLENPPFTINVKPWLGIATVETGYQEVDLEADESRR